MPNYNFMPNNKSDFPHIDNIDVYKFDNDFDYSRYDYTQMKLQICTVPWDMGEAHIGARTISGIGNVVYFETEENRDAWFDAIPDDECYRFETKFKELHRDKYIDVPIPFDMVSKHNYLVVEYSLFANDDSPIRYENADGLRKWFWFIREVEFLAPSTTRLHILDDAFQTWIYDVNVSGMILERGHAPMFDVSAEEYLSNPIENNTYLLTEDVNYGEAAQVSHIDALSLNSGDMYACVATTASAFLDWTDICPSADYYEIQGVPSVFVFAIPASNLNAFLTNVTARIPQFKQTVQGVFFASSQLVTLGEPFTFAGIACYSVFASRKTLNLADFQVSQFGYSDKYKDIAKLYTWPYARVEVTDENGDVTQIRIEDTTGSIDVSCAMSIAFPFVGIDAHLLGVGGGATASVTFKNLDERAFDMGGQWYETLHSWSVPTFAVVLDAASEYDYSTRFDRAQMEVDYTTEQSSANASADTLVANAALTQTANTATTNRSNQSANTDSTNTQNYNTVSNLAKNLIVEMSATSTIAANEQQGNISAASGVANAAVGAIAQGVSGNPLGAVSGLVSGAIGAASTIASTAVSNGLTAANASYTKAGNNASTTAANSDTANRTSNQTSTASDLTVIQNTLTAGTAANSAATQKANAAREANRAQSAIDNGIAQAALREPFTYGNFANGDTATTKPIGLFAHIVTQSKAAIEAAGDYMLRYGYALDRFWNFDGNWNIGKYFTYWKLRDFWVSDLNVPDLYMDKLRFFLFGGVTVWRRPEDIGKVTIYENYGE